MVFERATMADIDALTGLRLGYLTEESGPLTGEAVAAFRRTLPDYFRRNLGRALRAYVAREGGTCVACALLLMVDRPPSPRFPSGRTGTVYSVYTLPDYRRRGCARRLMELLLEDARALNLCLVELKATQAGAPLYEALGFRDAPSPCRPLAWRPEYETVN